MKYLRKVLICTSDRRRHGDRIVLEMTSLKVKERKLNWAEHLIRMDNTKLVKAIRQESRKVKNRMY